jgi:phage baseplate assembly protein W
MTILTKSSREYVDVDFNFNRHPMTDNVSIKKNVSSVKQSILHLLMLREGDKPFHPEIKSPIYGYLFENASSIVQVVLSGEVRKYINEYEPRVEVLDVEVSFPDQNAINCKVVGRMLNTSEPFTINILVDRLR